MAWLSGKTITSKEKAALLGEALLERHISTSECIAAAEKAKDAVKATCIEALEYATKQQPGLADASCLEFAVRSLADKAPRVKWESAKVIGNIAHHFPDSLDAAIVSLLANTEHPGTVVRWSAAFALGEIVQLPRYTQELQPALETIAAREEKSSIRKIYAAALKKAE